MNPAGGKPSHNKYENEKDMDSRKKPTVIIIMADGRMNFGYLRNMEDRMIDKPIRCKMPNHIVC